MAPVTRGTAALAAAFLAISPLAACGDDGGGGDEIGVLLPDTQTARWETFDRPLIEQRIKELCPDCSVETANARNSVATQQQQVHSMITRGVTALILAPVDATAIRSSVQRAEAAGIPVVAYDRLAEGPLSGYVSFDGEHVGRLQGEALLQALGDQAEEARIIMINGSPTDPNAALFAAGAHAVLDGQVQIGKEFDTPGWDPQTAFNHMSGALSDLGPDQIDAVYAANDGIASGAIAALKATNVGALPPVTGQDADLAAVQRIVEGEQYMTVYKPTQREAFPAAEMAVALGRGDSVDTIAEETVDNGTTENIPAMLADPIAVTADNLSDTVIDGLYGIDEICTPRYQPACERAGLV